MPRNSSPPPTEPPTETPSTEVLETADVELGETAASIAKALKADGHKAFHSVRRDVEKGFGMIAKALLSDEGAKELADGFVAALGKARERK